MREEGSKVQRASALMAGRLGNKLILKLHMYQAVQLPGTLASLRRVYQPLGAGIYF